MLSTLGRLAKKRWAEPLGVAVVFAMVISGSAAEAYPSHVYAGLHLVSHPDVAAFAVLALPAASLAWRRSHPLGVYAATVAGVGAWALIGEVYGAALVMVLVAFFTLCVERPGRFAPIALGAAGTLLIWVAGGIAGDWGWWGGPQLDLWAEMAAAGAAGAFVAARKNWKASERLRAADQQRARRDEIRRQIVSERLRIARELHDVVAHSMAMINVQASAAATLVATDPLRVTESLQAIRRASKDGLRELRSILEVLRQVDEQAPAVALPDREAFHALVEATRSAGVECGLIWDADMSDITPGAALAAYRIVQESLTNVVRHAARSVATVTIRRDGSAILVVVANDARGATETFTEGSGTGVAGMRERARSLNGSFQAGPDEGGGFKVRARLPIAAVEASGLHSSEPDHDSLGARSAVARLDAYQPAMSDIETHARESEP
jgi:signal transduction histidine kinase